MANWLERFRDSEVEIHYLTDNNAYKDRGRLVDYGDGWLELFKPEVGERGETFAIPTTSVRIMKILKPSAAPRPPEERLLRPVDTPTELSRPVEEDENSAVHRLRRG
jgi:hypothetical protein